MRNGAPSSHPSNNSKSSQVWFCSAAVVDFCYPGFNAGIVYHLASDQGLWSQVNRIKTVMGQATQQIYFNPACWQMISASDAFYASAFFIPVSSGRLSTVLPAGEKPPPPAAAAAVAAVRRPFSRHILLNVLGQRSGWVTGMLFVKLCTQGIQDRYFILPKHQSGPGPVSRTCSFIFLPFVFAVCFSLAALWHCPI